MTPAAFKRTLTHAVPPKALAPALAALWWAKKGDWEKAHRVVMDEHGREAAWVHAYLHRVEATKATRATGTRRRGGGRPAERPTMNGMRSSPN